MTKKIFIFAIVAALLMSLVGLGTFLYLRRSNAGPTTWIYLPQGTSRQALADSLQARFEPDFAHRVMLVVNAVTPDTLRFHGAFRVEHGEGVMTVAKRLVRGRQTPVRFTFSNVRLLKELTLLAAERFEFDEAEFDAALDSVLVAEGFNRATYPAAFIPDTYEFYWTDSATKVVGKLLDARNSFWTDERRAQASALGVTPVEVATICSIAEEESAKRDERPKIARLYLNRVHQGMKLQADPTVKYAVGDFTLRRIVGKHLKSPSPYNTYLHLGIPPGPIRIPQRATMEAFLQSEPHDYIYMCAKEDFSGYHNFARDYASHRANALRYQAALNERNIK